MIDVICYRRYGHNEGDEPYFTQPLMYDRIRERPSLHEIYADRLIEGSWSTRTSLDQMKDAIEGRLEKAYEEVHGSACPFPESRFYGDMG